MSAATTNDASEPVKKNDKNDDNATPPAETQTKTKTFPGGSIVPSISLTDSFMHMLPGTDRPEVVGDSTIYAFRMYISVCLSVCLYACLSVCLCSYTNTSIHQHINTQIHKYTNQYTFNHLKILPIIIYMKVSFSEFADAQDVSQFVDGYLYGAGECVYVCAYVCVDGYLYGAGE